ncbi:MAG: NUDIX domain-containing protein, partial [Fimbriimonadaceae bacterium]
MRRSITANERPANRAVTLQGAGAIVLDEQARVLLVRIERRGMLRWELPSAIRKGDETLLTTAYRCVEEDSGFSLRCRIKRPVCVVLNASHKLARSFFGIFFECEAEPTRVDVARAPGAEPELPGVAQQRTLAYSFLNRRVIPAKEM